MRGNCNKLCICLNSRRSCDTCFVTPATLVLHARASLRVVTSSHSVLRPLAHAHAHRCASTRTSPLLQLCLRQRVGAKGGAFHAWVPAQPTMFKLFQHILQVSLCLQATRLNGRVLTVHEGSQLQGIVLVRGQVNLVSWVLHHCLVPGNRTHCPSWLQSDITP